MKTTFISAFIDTSILTPETSDSIIQRADDYLQSLVDNRTFSGSVLLARHNQIILIKGYGCSEYVCHEKNNSQTIYRIGSVTKPFTAIIVLRLGERKQLRLNDRLSLYCPDYPNGDQITIKHLLSNTSGIEDYTEMEVFEKKCSQNLAQEELIAMFKSEPLKFKPGSKYSYSNSNVREPRVLIFTVSSVERFF
jgi:CubicO group peptidase (beta-lactamase class C family)